MKRPNTSEEGQPPRKVPKCVAYPKIEHFEVKFNHGVSLYNADINHDFAVNFTSTLNVNCAKYLAYLKERAVKQPRILEDSLGALFDEENVEDLEKNTCFQVGVLETCHLQSGRLIGMNRHKSFATVFSNSGLSDAVKLFKTGDHSLDLKNMEAEYSIGDYHFIQNIEMKEKWRGRGYGRALLQRFIDSQSAHDCFIVKPRLKTAVTEVLKEADPSPKIKAKRSPISFSFTNNSDVLMKIQETEDNSIELRADDTLLAKDVKFAFPEGDEKTITVTGTRSSDGEDTSWGFTLDEEGKYAELKKLVEQSTAVREQGDAQMPSPEVLPEEATVIPPSMAMSLPPKVEIPGASVAAEIPQETSTPIKRTIPVVNHPPYEIVFAKKPLGFSIEVPSGLVSSIQERSLLAQGLKLGSQLSYINGIKPDDGHKIKPMIRASQPPIRIVFTSPSPQTNFRTGLGKRQKNYKSGDKELPTSQYCGVSYRRSEKKWLAQIAHKGSKLNIGAFEREDDAARAWDAKAMELRGNQTPVNFPRIQNQPQIQKNPKQGKVHVLKRKPQPQFSQQLLKLHQVFKDMGFQANPISPEYLCYSSCYKQPPFEQYCKAVAEAKFLKEIQ